MYSKDQPKSQCSPSFFVHGTLTTHGSKAPSACHSTSRFPSELIDYIIDHLCSSKAVLSACSTVCKAWLPACRYHLFFGATLRPSLVRLLRTSPHAAETVVPYIRYVTFEGGWMRAEEFDEVIQFLVTLERVKGLHLETWSWEYIGAKATGCLLAAQGSLFQSLAKLDMAYTCFPSFAIMTAFISCFPLLMDLSFDNVTWKSPGSPALPLSSASVANSLLHLRTLKIRSCFNTPIPGYISDTLTTCTYDHQSNHDGYVTYVQHLKTLVLPDVLPSESNIVGSFLQALGTSLQNLELGFLAHDQNADPRVMQGVLDSIDLSYNTGLRIVHIHQLTLYRFPSRTRSPGFPPFSSTLTTDPPYKWLISLLSRLSSPGLTRVIFSIWLSMEHQLDLIDWAALFQNFMKPRTGEHCRIGINVCGMGRDRDKVRTWFGTRLRDSGQENMQGWDVRFMDE